jgi:hypothetical protein
MIEMIHERVETENNISGNETRSSAILFLSLFMSSLCVMQ